MSQPETLHFLPKSDLNKTALEALSSSASNSSTTPPFLSLLLSPPPPPPPTFLRSYSSYQEQTFVTEQTRTEGMDRARGFGIRGWFFLDSTVVWVALKAETSEGRVFLSSTCSIDEWRNGYFILCFLIDSDA